METKTYNVYKFDELSEEAKKSAIEKLSNINVEDDWWYKPTIEEWTEKLQRQGFESPEIFFSGFYSQGDGASFKATVNLSKFLKGRRCLSKYQQAIWCYERELMAVRIEKSGHYEHEMEMSLNITDYHDKMTDQLEDFILEEARDQARKIYKDLKEDYEYSASDEAIIETIKVNDYNFLEDGSLD